MKKYVLLMLLAGIAMAGCSCGDPEKEPEPTRIDAPIVEIENLDLDLVQIKNLVPDLTDIKEIEIPEIKIEIPAICVDIPEINITMCDAEIPLDTATQLRVLTMCADEGIDPYLVFAMIYHESRFDAAIIGDNGAAFGLMQIQPRWHKERIANLGVTNLLDPVQNVTVGIDYLAELINRGKGLEWALMCYNGGPALANRKANLNYATKIINTAKEFAER